MKTVRTALKGYNAETDTNPDHFSLFADDDNVLIKKKLTDSATLAQVTGAPGYTTRTVNHALGYIPFYVAFADVYSNGKWTLLNNQYNIQSVPEALSALDTSDLKIINTLPQTMPYAGDIFYDDMSQTGTPEITESSKVFKVAKSGVNALTSKNPNDYIVHSDLNNFKILKQGNATLTLSAGSGSATISHGASVTTPYKYFLFIKFPDGKTAFIGGGITITYSYDGNHYVFNNYMGSSNITFSYYVAGASSIDVECSYIIYGTANAGSLVEEDKVIKCVKAGLDAYTEKNPENFNFHSSYPTLKYYVSDTWNMGLISDNTVKTITHDLGYVPFFTAFMNDLAGVFFTSSFYCIAPYYWYRSAIPTPLLDIAGFVYADDTNLYLKAYYQTNAIGTAKSFNWYYKIFKNNLNL